MLYGLCPKQPVEENIEAGRILNLNYSMYVINFVNWMKYMEGTAPSRFVEVYNHASFSRFLGFSGHKKILSFRFFMYFMGSSWKKHVQKGNKK